MNCNRIARVYRLLEYAAFGRRLHWHRRRFLSAARGVQRALVLGDGDGRFLADLLLADPDLQVDAIDSSSGMLALARRAADRLGPQVRARVRFLQADARICPLPSARYDLFVTHFFLDCFPDASLESLIQKLKLHASENAAWIISEFHQPRSGWGALHAAVWLKAMYLFFRMTTGLKTGRLPNYRPLLEAQGFVLTREETSFGQLISSQLWRFSGPPCPDRASRHEPAITETHVTA